MNFSDLATSCAIFAKAYPDYYPSAEHDVLYGPAFDTDEVPSKDDEFQPTDPVLGEERSRKLYELGWMYCREFGCWQAFT